MKRRQKKHLRLNLLYTLFLTIMIATSSSYGSSSDMCIVNTAVGALPSTNIVEKVAETSVMPLIKSYPHDSVIGQFAIDTADGQRALLSSEKRIDVATNVVSRGEYRDRTQPAPTTTVAAVQTEEPTYETIGGHYTTATDINSSCGYDLEKLRYIVSQMGDFKDSDKIAEALYNADSVGVNARFIFGVAIQETGRGTSSLANNKNNILGIRAYDSSPYHSAKTYIDQGQCVTDFVTIMTTSGHYIDVGRDSAGEINSVYASDQHWSMAVTTVMNEMDRYASEYDSLFINTSAEV